MTDRILSPLFTWRGAVASPESELEPTTRHVALTLSLHMNEKGGSAFPGASMLAGETGLAESTVREHLRLLVDQGWLELAERGGLKGQRRRANAYRATIPAPLREPVGSLDPTPPGVVMTPPGAGANPSGSRTPGRHRGRNKDARDSEHGAARPTRQASDHQRDLEDDRKRAAPMPESLRSGREVGTTEPEPKADEA